MAELVGYIAPDVRSGSFVAGQISFAPPDINSSITTLKDLLVSTEWTNPTVPGGGDTAGTKAIGTLTALSFPAHNTDSTGSGVPDTFGGAFAGTFDGLSFQFYDPLASPPDPDPATAGVVWVPLATSSLGTLDNFLGLATSHTRWTFALVSGTAIEATLSVTAKLNGPDGNIDADTGSWAPAGTYLGGPGPTGGGWYLYSAPAPVTGDVLRLGISENTVGGTYPVIALEMPAGSGNSVTLPLASLPYNYGFNRYQVALRNVPGTSYPVGGTNFLAAALNVPTELGPASIAITGVVNASGGPVVVTTEGPHNLTMQDRVAIAEIVGAANVNGRWWVASLPSDDTLQLSQSPLVFIYGDGSTYTGEGGVSATGGPLLQIVDVRNDVADPVLISTLVPHNYKPGMFIELGGIGGIPTLAGEYSVAAVPLPTTFEIATADAGLLNGNGDGYSSGGTLTAGIFQAMFATGDFTDTLYDGGQNTAVAVQGVFGSFPLQQRLHADGSLTAASLAPYSVAVHIPFTGLAPGDDTSSLDLMTSAAKAITIAPYVATRIAPGQEARLTGTLWDSYIETQKAPGGYGQNATYQDTLFMAWVVHDPTLPSVTATLWMKAQDISY